MAASDSISGVFQSVETSWIGGARPPSALAATMAPRVAMVIARASNRLLPEPREAAEQGDRSGPARPWRRPAWRPWAPSPGSSGRKPSASGITPSFTPSAGGDQQSRRQGDQHRQVQQAGGRSRPCLAPALASRLGPWPSCPCGWDAAAWPAAPRRRRTPAWRGRPPARERARAAARGSAGPGEVLLLGDGLRPGELPARARACSAGAAAAIGCRLRSIASGGDLAPDFSARASAWRQGLDHLRLGQRRRFRQRLLRLGRVDPRGLRPVGGGQGGGRRLRVRLGVGWPASAGQPGST
jgi:hypothetical protein